MSARSVFVIAVLLLAGAARAAEQLPVIATYELQRRREALYVERTDPKAFWIRQIVARLGDGKSSAPLGLKQSATVRVSFAVGRDGTLVSRTVSTTSGVPAADAEALALLDRAQPFPPMPQAMTDDALTFSLPLRFR